MNVFFYLSTLILQTTIWPIVRPLAWFFLRLDVRGLEHFKTLTFTYGRTPIPKLGVIFVVNHSSELDPILVPASLPFLSPFMPMFYASRERGFYKSSGWRRYCYGGILFKFWGAHRLQSGGKNYEQSLAPHIALLERGNSLLMFPDGKKTSEAEIGTFAHGGIGYLAWRTKAIVIPVKISGDGQTTLSDFFLRRRRVRVIFGVPLYLPTVASGVEPTVNDCRASARLAMQAVRGLR